MPIKIKILSFLLFPILLFSQEDSTVNLLPHFKKGGLLNYTISTSLVALPNGVEQTKSEVYDLNLELLKSAYGLSVFKAVYSSETERVKTGLDVYFTIDSNKRFLAIENEQSIQLELNKKTIDSSFLSLDSTYIGSIFPELDLIFFLNGAKYKIGEIYKLESFILSTGKLVPADIQVEMTSFDRELNRFEIVVNVLSNKEGDSSEAIEYFYLFNLNTLKLIEMRSKQRYTFEGIRYQKSLNILLKTN